MEDDPNLEDDLNRVARNRSEQHMASNRRMFGVFAGLLALVAALLVGGSLLAQRLRQPTSLQPAAGSPTATITLVVTTAPSTQSIATIPPTAGPSPTTVALATATPTPAPTMTASPEASRAATVALPIRPETPPPGATVLPGARVLVPASPTAIAVSVPPELADSPLVSDLVTGYLHYWEIRTQAFRMVDPVRLPEVLADPELGFDQARISQLRAMGRAVRLQGEHTITIFRLTPDSAVLVDQFANRSVAIELATGNDVPELAPALQKLVYTLRKIDGVWKVVEVQQQ